jgi:hypothetical protein
MKRAQPLVDDELQMRAFWRQWHTLMQGCGSPRCRTPCHRRLSGLAYGSDVTGTPRYAGADRGLSLREAALLDTWQLQEWLELLTEDATYEVPSTDAPDGDARTTLFIIADNIERFAHGCFSCWANRPGPRTLRRTRRLISNVRIRAVEGDKHTRHGQFCRLPHALRAGGHVRQAV